MKIGIFQAKTVTLEIFGSWSLRSFSELMHRARIADSTKRISGCTGQPIASPSSYLSVL
jgi:hypothetical protein